MKTNMMDKNWPIRQRITKRPMFFLVAFLFLMFLSEKNSCFCTKKRQKKNHVSKKTELNQCKESSGSKNYSDTQNCLNTPKTTNNENILDACQETYSHHSESQKENFNIKLSQEETSLFIENKENNPALGQQPANPEIGSEEFHFICPSCNIPVQGILTQNDNTTRTESPQIFSSLLRSEKPLPKFHSRESENNALVSCLRCKSCFNYRKNAPFATRISFFEQQPLISSTNNTHLIKTCHFCNSKFEAPNLNEKIANNLEFIGAPFYNEVKCDACSWVLESTRTLLPFEEYVRIFTSKYEFSSNMSPKRCVLCSKILYDGPQQSDKEDEEDKSRLERAFMATSLNDSSNEFQKSCSCYNTSGHITLMECNCLHRSNPSISFEDSQSTTGIKNSRKSISIDIYSDFGTIQNSLDVGYKQAKHTKKTSTISTDTPQSLSNQESAVQLNKYSVSFEQLKTSETENGSFEENYCLNCQERYKRIEYKNKKSRV